VKRKWGRAKLQTFPTTTNGASEEETRMDDEERVPQKTENDRHEAVTKKHRKEADIIREKSPKGLTNRSETKNERRM